MENLPLYLSLGFMLVTLASIYIFYRAANNSDKILLIIIGWVIMQTVVSYSGFYENFHTWPPRFALLILPPLALIVALFSTKRGRRFIDEINIKILTLIHLVRIPVELILLGLFFYELVPRIMTFEGRNYDILAGLSAPLIFYFGFMKKKLNNWIMLLWNFVSLALLMNIVIIAILSTPLKFQQFGFEQPNIALFYFPFTLLPAIVVPLVLLSHLISIRKLVLKHAEEKDHKASLSL